MRTHKSRRTFIGVAATVAIAGCLSQSNHGGEAEGVDSDRIGDCETMYSWAHIDGGVGNRNRTGTAVGPGVEPRRLVGRVPFEYSSYNVADGNLIVHDSDGHVVAIDVDTGSLVWNDASPVEATSTRLHRVQGPVTTCGTVVTQTDAQTFAYDLESGALVWDRAVGSVRKRPGLVAIDDRVLVSRMDRIDALDLADGIPTWNVQYTDLDEWDHSGGTQGIAVQEDRVYVTVGHSDPADGFTLALDAESGDVLWINPEASSRSRPSIGNDLLLVRRPQGEIVALDLDTGDREFRVDDVRQTLDLRTFTVDEERGQFYDVHPQSDWLAAYSLEDGGLRWRTSFEGRIDAPPLATEEAVLVPADDLLFFDPDTGESEGSIDLDVRYPMAADEHRIFAGTDDGTYVIGEAEDSDSA